MISEKARSYANGLFSTAPIMTYRALLRVLSTQGISIHPKLTRFVVRRITQMHHFSEQYDKFLSYIQRAYGITVGRKMVHTNPRKEHSMETIHITQAHEGEHWLVVTDVTTIKAQLTRPRDDTTR